MKIGLVQVDGKLPNHALMQVCRYHELQGDTVERYKGSLFADDYDLIYASKIFQYSAMPQLPERAMIGGTGIDFKNRLPAPIEECEPSYTLEPDCNFHIGFSMKGCRMGCKFCCVPQKEGRPYVYASVDELLINPKGGNRLMLLDNDFFGVETWEKNLWDIRYHSLKVCFAQGLNIRIITEEQAKLLALVDYTNSRFNQKYLTFAWDRYNDMKKVLAGIDRCVAAGIPTRHMQFFVLIGFDTTPEQDMERVMTLANLGCLPFVMPYNREDRYQKDFARWVNFRSVFRSVKWEDYHAGQQNRISQDDLFEDEDGIYEF
jgi:hypothetical protein